MIGESGLMGLLNNLLARQDPSQPHTLLTRGIVSIGICFAFFVLCGFYGVVGAIMVYLLGVELLGLPQKTTLVPLLAGLLFGCWKSVLALRDYWANHGNGGD